MSFITGTKNFMITVDELIEPLRKIADSWASPALDLLFRVYIGYGFFNSGLLRFNSFLNGDWETQIFLFDFEHPIPGIPAEIAAPAATFGELFLPILLVTGLFGRFGAAGLLIMTFVIEAVYGDPDAFLAKDHMIWAAMLSVIFIKGPGKFSLDYLLRKWLHQGKEAESKSAA